jgi:hypothetical protein
MPLPDETIIHSTEEIHRMETVVGSFDDLQRAQDAASAIMNTGTIAADLDLMFMEGHDRVVTAELLDVNAAQADTSPIEPDMQLGRDIPVAVPIAAAGSTPNLLTGQGSLNNPGIAPALAVGALVDRARPRTAVAHHSADPRGVSQALTDESVPADLVPDLSEQLSAGRVLLIAHVGPEKVALVSQVLQAHGSMPALTAQTRQTSVTIGDEETVSFETDLVAPTEGTTSSTSDRQYAEAPAILGATQEATSVSPIETGSRTSEIARAGASIDGASAGSNAEHSGAASQPAGPTVSGASIDNPLIADDFLGDTNAGTRLPTPKPERVRATLDMSGHGLEHDDLEHSDLEAAGAGSGF